MIQAQRQRVESAVTELIDDMDKTHLRKMQVNSSYHNSPHKWFKHDLNSNVFPLIMTDRNAFVCGKVLPGQHIKRGQRAALRRSLLRSHDPSAELCAARAGRISGPPPTLRHGEHWNPWIIIRLYSLYIWWWTCMTHSNATMMWKWKCHPVPVRSKSLNIPISSNVARFSVWISMLDWYPALWKRWKRCLPRAQSLYRITRRTLHTCCIYQFVHPILNYLIN